MSAQIDILAKRAKATVFEYLIDLNFYPYKCEVLAKRAIATVYDYLKILNVYPDKSNSK